MPLQEPLIEALSAGSAATDVADMAITHGQGIDVHDMRRDLAKCPYWVLPLGVHFLPASPEIDVHLVRGFPVEQGQDNLDGYPLIFDSQPGFLAPFGESSFLVSELAGFGSHHFLRLTIRLSPMMRGCDAVVQISQ